MVDAKATKQHATLKVVKDLKNALRKQDYSTESLIALAKLLRISSDSLTGIVIRRENYAGTSYLKIAKKLELTPHLFDKHLRRIGGKKRSRRDVSDRTLKRLKAKYDKGNKTVNQLKEEFGIKSTSTLYKLLKKIGVKKRGQKNRKRKKNSKLKSGSTIVPEYLAGASMEKIGKRHGSVTRETIRQFLKKNGISGKSLGRIRSTGRRGNRKVSDRQLELLKKEEDGVSDLEKTAKKLKISISTLRKYRKMLGIKPRRSGNKNKISDSDGIKIIGEYNTRVTTLAEIGEKYGVTNSLILRYVKNHGVKKRGHVGLYRRSKGKITTITKK